MVGKLVGQYSDSSRVSRSLQTPSRESKKLKPVQRKRGRERIYQQAFIRGSASVSQGGSWPGRQEPLWISGAEEERRRIDSPLASQL